MNRIVLFIFLFILFPFVLQAQEKIPFRVVFWNVENLFDCKHDSLKNDHEFLPESSRNWHYGRYKEKLTTLSKVIVALCNQESPALIGVCEVENDTVMRDLTRHSPLKELGYRYVMTHSPDERGIDVALLYRRDKFKLLTVQSVPVVLDTGKPTRDILHVSGLVATLDTLDVFVVHFPSRSGGEKRTEPNRIKAAQTLKHKADSLVAQRLNPYIIIMGDLNDYPRNKSISQVLDAKTPQPPVNGRKLYHLLADKAGNRGYGSYKFQETWGLLDHLIVSGAMLQPGSRVRTGKEKADVARLPFMLEPDDKHGGHKPFRTYNGLNYQGGYSDHLPVYLDIELTVEP